MLRGGNADVAEGYGCQEWTFGSNGPGPHPEVGVGWGECMGLRGGLE